MWPVFEELLTAVRRCMKAAGLPVQPAMAASAMPEGAVVSVGLAEGELCPAGAGAYLGLTRDRETGDEVEQFGCRAELTLFFDCWSMEGGGACLELFQQAAASLEGLAGGLRLRQISCGEAAYDKGCRRFHCRGTARGTAFFVAEADGETAVIRDFTLRGVIRDDRDQ